MSADGGRNIRIIPVYLRMSLARDEAGQEMRGSLVALPGNKVPILSEQCEVHFSHPTLKVDNLPPVSSDHILTELSGEGETHITAKGALYWLRRAADSEISPSNRRVIADRLFHLAQQEKSSAIYTLALEQYLKVAASITDPKLYARLSDMYGRGLGTTSNAVEAKKWSDLSTAMKPDIATNKAVCLHGAASRLLMRRLDRLSGKPGSNKNGTTTPATLKVGTVVGGTNFQLKRISWLNAATRDDPFYCAYTFYERNSKPNSNPDDADVDEFIEGARGENGIPLGEPTRCDSALLFECTKRERELDQDFSLLSSTAKSLAIGARIREERISVTPNGSHRFKLEEGTGEEATVDVSSKKK